MRRELHTYANVCIHRTYMHIHIHIHTHIHTYIHTYIHACMHACMQHLLQNYMYTHCIHIHVVHAGVRKHVDTYACMYICTCRVLTYRHEDPRDTSRTYHEKVRSLVSIYHNVYELQTNTNLILGTICGQTNAKRSMYTIIEYFFRWK